ncbi:copia-type polyprotein, partial [Trifolium medium]|nr:copia-type polyprotein [Trifolium medium]
CPIKRLENTTPEECWSGKGPNVSHLRVFGSIAYIHVHDQLRRKLDDKGDQMVLVMTGGYKLLNPINKQIVINRDVIYDEMNGPGAKMERETQLAFCVKRQTTMT